MPLPFVAKLPKASMGEGVWLIESRKDWLSYCEKTPVLYVQEYLPIDRDVRVVVVGDQVVTAYWRTQAEQGFYNNVARGGALIMRRCRRLLRTWRYDWPRGWVWTMRVLILPWLRAIPTCSNSTGYSAIRGLGRVLS